MNRAHIETKEMQYLYRTGDEFTFMDTQSYEQLNMTSDSLGEATKWLKDNMTIGIQFYQGKPIGVDVPTFVELVVTQTDPGVRGDTVSGATKPATMETGVVVQVPLFVNEGDVLRIDTRTGAYLSRV